MITVSVLIIEFIFLAWRQIFGITECPDPVMQLLIIFVSFAFLCDVLRNKQPYFIKILFILGYIFRIGLLIWYIYFRTIYVLPQSGGDTERFFRLSSQIASGKSPENIDISSVAGYIFRVIGISRIYMQFLFLCCAMVSLVIANKIMQLLNVDLKNRKIAMAVLCLIPNYAILSVLFLRESLIIMMISISLFLFIKWFLNGHSLYFLLSIIPIILSSMLHSGVIGVLIGYFFVQLLYNRKKKRFRLTLSRIVPSIILGVLIVFLFNNYGNIFFKKMNGIEEISDISGVVDDRGRSSYAAYVGNSKSFVNMIIYTPIRIIFFQFSPFIWQIGNLGDIIAICFNALFYLIVWYKTIKYIIAYKVHGNEIIVALFIIWISMTFVFAWGVTNTGTAIRHRDKMVILAGVLLGLTMKSDQDNTSKEIVHK